MDTDRNGLTSVRSGCAGCGVSLATSASAYWCSESCQTRWYGEQCGVPEPDVGSLPIRLLTALTEDALHRRAASPR